ncbi:uncharacterized protein LOC125901063 [Epinephelus fuscoguttatus]|uniref:uncharacterized protein LOC125901063 n=1 Tax=Epinephelus fuscoguttatus TaxID=293821 RepID=UPI0020D0A2E8|nr:uncharacterized protein LOC125901063 [Epinephelus fuscoguttatus]
MATLSTCFVEGTSYMRSGEEEDGNKEVKEEEKDKSAVQTQQRPAWAPYVHYKPDREVYHYVGQDIVIDGALDSYAGMIWPGALALCQYLETHCEELNLVGKAVLEIGAGTGLTSVVATLLGAWVTATDLPDVLNNLRANLFRNTRGRWKYMPQVAALSWGQDLESTYPSSVYRYDYVLAADVVYHHDFQDELLAVMKHFCKPGTSLIWANKVRYESDLTFTENFKKAFHTKLLVEDGEMKIFMATCREEGEGDQEIQDLLKEEEEGKEEKKRKEQLGDEKHKGDELHSVSTEQSKGKDIDVREEPRVSEPERGDDKEDKNKHESDGEEEMVHKDDDYKEDKKDEPDLSCSSTANEEDAPGQTNTKTAEQQDSPPAWASIINRRFGRDIYHYVGHDIVIQESIDSYGAVMWPAALALCSYLENNRNTVNLQGKEVLELGSGTGLVTIVASLLGASVTATDLPDVLSNLQANVTRNTRGRCRHTPKVEILSWGHNLERTYPSSLYRYDYVLAADVVYHHDFLNELLATMKHFCTRGTTVIWANKVRFETDLTFTENFKKAFHTSLLAEDGEMKIFMGTFRG